MEKANFSVPPGHPKWSQWDVVVVLGILLGIMLLSRFFRNAIRQVIRSLVVTGNNPATLALFLGTVIQAAVIIAAVFWLARRRGAAGRDLGLVWNNSRKNILTGLFGGLLSGIIIWFITILISAFLGPPPPQEVELLLSGFRSGRDLLLPFLAISVLAPVSEELYFRGMVYPTVRARFGPAIGMVLSALFFGLLHFDLYRLIPITVLGVILAYFYERTHSLLASIVAHSTWNTFMLLIVLAAGKNIQ